MNNNYALYSDDLIVKLDATSAELDELIQTGTKEIKKAIASHPNTAPETLVKLFEDYSEEVLSNPSLRLIVLEDQNFLDKLLNKTRYYLSEIPKLPEFFIDWAVNHSQASIRSKIAGNHYIPINFLDQLAQDIDECVRVSAAGTICMSDRHFEWLYGKKAINRTVNNHRDETLKIIGQLAQDKSMNVRYVVANNTGTPTHILEQLSFDQHWQVLGAVAKNCQTSEKTLRKLFQSKYKLVTEAVARNRNIPHDLMEICAASNEYRLRYFIAGNPNATKDILAKLACEKNEDIHQQVVNNPNFLQNSLYN